MCADANKRSWLMRVQDILESIAKIKKYTDGMSFDQFSGDSLRVDAVIRNLEIIGEAATHIPVEIQTRYAEIPWFEMRGMRNIITHEYFGVSLAIVWRTVTHDLGPIEEQFARLLDNEASRPE